MDINKVHQTNLGVKGAVHCCKLDRLVLQPMYSLDHKVLLHWSFHPDRYPSRTTRESKPDNIEVNLLGCTTNKSRGNIQYL